MFTTFVASIALAVGSPVAAPGHTQNPTRPGCHRLYTVAQVKTMARATYRGTRHVTTANRYRLAGMSRCLQNTHAHPYVEGYIHRTRLAWLQRVWDVAHPLHGPVVASWYYDGGGTACGFHATYGFASLTLPCGAHVTMYGPNGRPVDAVMQDRGPYVGGRTFDFNPALNAATGCGGSCTDAALVHWRLGWQ